MVWPNPGLPIARDLVGRLPDQSFLDKPTTPQVMLFNPPTLLNFLVPVNAMHALVLLVNADILLNTTARETEASVPASLDPTAFAAMVPTAMVFHCNEGDGRGAPDARLRDNCPLVDQVYAVVVIGTVALAAGAASCENPIGDIG